MPPNPAKKTLLQRQIPTILGLLVLVVALVAGIFFLGQGPGVFAPRATPQTTPKKIKVTNVTDTGFTVSFLTDEATAGFIKYGTAANELKSQSSDDRDQLSGTIGQYQTHHITIRGLQPGTKYFYTLGTGSRASFDNNGAPFEITTAKRAGAPSAAKTAYGSIVAAAGGPAEGALVYIAIEGVGEMSSLVKSSGSFAVPLSNARTADGSSYAQIKDTDMMSILVQGPANADVAQVSATVADSQPVATITLGQGGSVATTQVETEATEDSEESSESAEVAEGEEAEEESDDEETEDSETGGSALLSGLDDEPASSENSSASSSAQASASTNATASAEIESRVVDLESDEEQVVNTQTPIIMGKAAPRVRVSIEVNSETQITQELVTDENGDFQLDLEALKAQLEPGEHTATYSYTDPDTGELVTKTVSFVVEAPSSSSTQLAQAATPTPRPFGSGNPYTISSPSPSASASASPSATPSIGGATRSANPATNSAIPVSGSIGTTLALMIGGLFFITAGVWSFWLAREYGEVVAE